MSFTKSWLRENRRWQKWFLWGTFVAQRSCYRTLVFSISNKFQTVIKYQLWHFVIKQSGHTKYVTTLKSTFFVYTTIQTIPTTWSCHDQNFWKCLNVFRILPLMTLIPLILSNLAGNVRRCFGNLWALPNFVLCNLGKSVYDLDLYCLWLGVVLFRSLTIRTVEILNNYCTVYKEMQTTFILKIPRKTFFWGTLRTPAEKDFVTP